MLYIQLFLLILALTLGVLVGIPALVIFTVLAWKANIFAGLAVLSLDVALFLTVTTILEENPW